MNDKNNSLIYFLNFEIFLSIFYKLKFINLYNYYFFNYLYIYKLIINFF